VRWLLQPAEIKNQDGSALPIAAVIGLNAGGITASRQELEMIASSIN
jgi:hypothetical protein